MYVINLLERRRSPCLLAAVSCIHKIPPALIAWLFHFHASLLNDKVVDSVIVASNWNIWASGSDNLKIVLLRKEYIGNTAHVFPFWFR